MGAGNQFLTDDAERSRLKAFDRELLVTRTTEKGSSVFTTYELNTERELAKMIDAGNTLDYCVIGDAVEKLDKGLEVAQVAEMVYGSRHRYYCDRIARTMVFDGPVNPHLDNGGVVNVEHGLVFKTQVDADFASFAWEAGAKAARGAERSVTFQTDRLNATLSMLERKNPAVAAISGEVRDTVYGRVSVSIPAKLKAMAPVKPAKKP
jgi:hypothetical protein